MTAPSFFTSPQGLNALPRVLLLLALAAAAPCLSQAASRGARSPRLVVNSLADNPAPPQGEMTLRAALALAPAGATIAFDPSLDGATILLTSVGDEHTPLPAETYTNNVFAGFSERDHGRSALSVRSGSITIDASALPRGLTLAWAGGAERPARVLAVHGNLVMNNITLTGGHSRAEPTGLAAQPYTLARGGGLAVWGTATLTRCTISENRVDGDLNPSRDRGAFGGGIYGDRLVLSNCVVSGNVVTGFGAAGGGIYSVGGAGTPGRGSSLTACALTGNRLVGQHAYGGGIFSAGGGAGRLEILTLRNCTVARNLVMDNDALPEVSMFQYYYRGGGVYMSNGSLSISSCTIVENSVWGHPATFGGKPNMGGGGVAATIGNAHVVEQIELWHSIIAGNTLNGQPADLFSGSLLFFTSYGYNRVGVLDFSQILVPVPLWYSLSRKHWPKTGDQDGVALAEVLDLAAPRYHDSVTSAGTDAGSNVVLSYPPQGAALDQIPRHIYVVPSTLVQYSDLRGRTNNVLNTVVQMLRTDYAAQLGSDFGSQFGDLSGITFTPEPNTWPADPANAPWIAFWRNLDAAIAGRLGAAGLNDDFWIAFRSRRAQAGVSYRLTTHLRRVRLLAADQDGTARPVGGGGDIGAIER